MMIRKPLRLNGVDHTAPSLDLCIRIDAGHAGIAAARCRHRRGFRDQQAGRRGALAIIFCVQRPWRETRPICAHPRQWSHHDAMGKPVGPDLKRRKQTREIHLPGP